MTKPRIHRYASRRRKKSAVPLSILRTSDAVKTIVSHPRRLHELLQMLNDKDRSVRARAAAALAHLSESHPDRLSRIILRLREGLGDDSAYVRWNLIYALGQLGTRFPMQLHEITSDLVAALDDSNRIVRVLASRTLELIASQKAQIVEQVFQNLKREIPAPVARILKKSSSSRKARA